MIEEKRKKFPPLGLLLKAVNAIYRMDHILSAILLVVRNDKLNKEKRSHLNRKIYEIHHYFGMKESKALNK